MLNQVLSKSDLSLGQRLSEIHDDLRTTHPSLCRIAVAIYDNDKELLKTYAHSSDGESPISFYEAPLAQAKSLQEIANDNKPRIIDDLSVVEGKNPHSKRIVNSGYLSSLTIPIKFNGNLYGFLFFNAAEKGYFSDGRMTSLKPYAGVISLLVINDLQTFQTLRGAVQTAREFSRHRDEETANHLERMSQYSRLIAKELGPKAGKCEDWIEYVYQFAPLHDVGKVAIPDEILLKPGKLTTDEYDIMKTHVTKGGEIVNVLSKEFGLETHSYLGVLQNIVLYHHETLDGTGYPSGISGGQIPLEARIVAVADIFDALTSTRPYKHRWSNEDAIDLLKELAGVRLDEDCVNTLIGLLDKVSAIQDEFEEDFEG